MRKLLWLDLEMTGLNPKKDVIIEVGAVITDESLKELAAYQSGVRHARPKLEKLLAASDWHAARPDYTQSMLESSLKGKSALVVQREILRLIEQHIGLTRPAEDFKLYKDSLVSDGEVMVAGSVISTDMAFINAQWLILKPVLHYSFFDVSTLETIVPKRLPTMSNHRALDDIRLSIEQTRNYLVQLGIKL